MVKKILVLIIVSIFLMGAAPTRQFTYTTGNTIEPSEVTSNEDALFNYLQTGVDTYSANSIATASIQDSAITSGKLGADSVTSAKISSGTIVDSDISSSAAIGYGKLYLTASIVGSDIKGNSNIGVSTVSASSSTTTSGLTVNGSLTDSLGAKGTSGQILRNQAGLTQWQSAGVFTDRGDPAAADFTQASLTGDNTWRDLDLSAVVPSGAVAISISLFFNDGSTNIPIDWRKNGNTNTFNIIRTYTSSTAAQNIGHQIIVPCDSSRIIEYRISEAIDSLTGTVVGWF